MKKLILISLTAILLACSSSKPVVQPVVDKTQWPLQKRLDQDYYNNLKTCLSNPPSADIKFIQKCLGGEFLLELADKEHTSQLNIETIQQLSVKETPALLQTVLLLNASDSLHLAIDYENCVDCPIKVKAFSLYYQSSLLKSKIIGGRGF